jgi:Rad3-related DNA helicase
MYDKKVIYSLKYEPRDTQIEALEFVKYQIRHGKKYMMLNSPTGTGKSFFAVMFINWYLNHINPEARFDLLTNSKVLQNQYTKEFPFIRSLKGRNSYTCDTYNCSCDEGKQMNAALKRSCTNCPYDAAYASWTLSDVALTNFHLFDTLHLFVPAHIEKKKCNVLIIDEADNFESIICDFISMKISDRSLKLLGFSDTKIQKIGQELINVKTVLKFIDFINDFFIGELDMQLENMKSLLSKDKISTGEKVKISKYITNLNSALESYKTFSKSMDESTDDINNWVIDIEKDNNIHKKSILPMNYTIQPVWSHTYLENYIWKHYDHIIFMSGTLLNKEMFAYLNGLETSLCAYYDIKSPFPVKNRPIYFTKGIGKMTFDNKKATWEKQKVMLDKIIKKYEKEKGIIHTVNYEIAGWIKEHYKYNDRFIFHDATNREEALHQHMTSTKPTILVSPSMSTGVDLKDDLSRFQVVMKLPYGNISSNKIKKRMNDYKDWYDWNTCGTLIQMCGRSIRNMDDHCDTFVLDDSLSNVLKYSHKFLPTYFTEAIKILKI